MQQIHKNVEDLGDKSIKRLLWKYFWPAFAGLITNALYNVVDRIFIGQGVNAYALSGLSAVFPVMLIIMAFGMLIGMGAGVRISINLGKNDKDRAEKVLGNALFLIVLISIVITFVGFLIKNPILQLFGAGDETINYANDYLDIILLGTIFAMVGYSLNNMIRSEGNARVAMYSMFLSAGINMILDPIFIFGLGMGVKGAAYATVISQMVLTLWVLLHFLSSRSVVKLKISNLKIRWDIVFNIVAVGFAPFAMQVAGSFVQGTFNKQLITHGGDLAVGAMGIIMSVAMLLVMAIIAINMAAQPILGFNFGSNNLARVKQTFIICMKAATIVSVLGFIIVEGFPDLIVSLFNSDNAQLKEIGVSGMRIFMVTLPIVGFQIVAGSYFQSIGKAGIAAILSMLRQVIVLIPVLLILPDYLGLAGVWLSMPIADFVSAIIVSIFVIRELKRLNLLISANKSNLI